MPEDTLRGTWRKVAWYIARFRSLEQRTAQALSASPTPALGSAVPTSAIFLRGVRATPMVIYTV
jgi:hypothetical protein